MLLREADIARCPESRLNRTLNRTRASQINEGQLTTSELGPVRAAGSNPGRITKKGIFGDKGSRAERFLEIDARVFLDGTLTSRRRFQLTAPVLGKTRVFLRISTSPIFFLKKVRLVDLTSAILAKRIKMATEDQSCNPSLIQSAVWSSRSHFVDEVPQPSAAAGLRVRIIPLRMCAACRLAHGRVMPLDVITAPCNYMDV